MEHRGRADAGAEVARVCGDRQHGLRRCPEEEVVPPPCCGSDVGDGGRHGDGGAQPRRLSRGAPRIGGRRRLSSARPAYRAEQAGHLSLAQLKVMSAVETCRTTPLNGHVEAVKTHVEVPDRQVG